MKSFFAGLFVLLCMGLCVSGIFAEESSPENVPSPIVIANQEVSSKASSLDSSMSIVVDHEVSTEADGSMVSVDDQNDDHSDDHNDVIQRVVIESVAPAPEKVVAFSERSAFNRMKQLVGRWEGLGENVLKEKSNKIVVVYEVTAGGNAVMERIFPSTSQEMITMYYEQKGQLALTHYCLIGTRSTMVLKPAVISENSRKNDVYEFNLIENDDLDPTVDTHMNSLKITFIDENHMNQSWEMFEAGKPSGSYSFVLTRVVDKP